MSARIYPNGESVVWVNKLLKDHHYFPKRTVQKMEYDQARVALKYGDPELFAALLLMGLSLVPILRDASNDCDLEVVETPTTRAVKGRNGITRHGARMVRNAAYLMQEKYGKARLAFATTTLPSVPFSQLAIIHGRWAEVVKDYRHSLKKALEAANLPGELITVTEIQSKRFERTGVPALHLHTVFVGLGNTGWAIPTDFHDYIWEKAVTKVCPDLIGLADFRCSCNIQSVKKSAASYLGKYMSKGSKEALEVASAGFEEWLPKHWWNCTRSLRQWVEMETLRPDCAWLLVEHSDNRQIWQWCQEVMVEMPDGCKACLAIMGKLNPDFNKLIREYGPQGLEDSVISTLCYNAVDGSRVKNGL